MTGEITLRGRVLPIGGLREKTIAAKRGGITTVIIPEENEKDIKDIPDRVRKGMTIIPVSHADEVLEIALEAGASVWKGRVAKKMDEAARPPLDPDKAQPTV